jgi:hypothetical protein
MTTRIVLILGVLILALIACKLPAPPTLEPVVVVTPTSVVVVPMPTETLPPRPTITSPLSPLATPAIVAQQEGSPLAALTLVKLQPGRKYRLSVTSRAGAVAFSGTWSTSAVGTDGLPGVKTGLLGGKTPADYDIVPPVTKVAKDWVYSASASSTSGGIAVTILDVTP